MKAVLCPRAPHHREWCEPFAQGLRRHGWQAVVQSDPSPCDLLVLWGVRRKTDIDGQKRRGGEVCILERAYLGDRFKWTSVSFGGELNGRAEFRTKDDPARFNAHFGHMLKPWQRRDGYALLIGQVPGDAALRSVNGDLLDWYRETTADSTAQGFDVRFRPHPEAVRRGLGPMTVDGASASEGALGEALRGAGLVITFNSNTAVESVLAGVPTMAADPGSMAWPVTSHAVEIVTPDRSEWAARLAWCQWTADEMASGECWEAVKI